MDLSPYATAHGTDTLRVDGLPTLTVPVSDRGFQYGDGVFTTLPVRQGIPELLRRHLERLERDARRLGIPMPDRRLWMQDIRGLLAGSADGILKLQLTRGSGGRGYRPPAPASPRRVAALHPLPFYPADLAAHGVAVRVCHTRLGLNPSLAGLKHMNRLEQILARSEWTDEVILEGIVLDAEGHLAEGTMSNLFLVKDERLLTPALDRCGVAGIMRGLVLECAAEQGIPAEEGRFRLADLESADEAFLTNSVIGLWPIRRMDDREIPIGPLAHRMRDWLRERIATESVAWDAV